MDCCENLTPEFTGEPEVIADRKIIGRRTALKQLAGLASGIMFISKKNAYGQGRQVLLAFCGQLLCVIPYEVTRARGHFADEGLDVRLVYTRGGNVAMQALVGGSVDYAGTSFDVALQAYAHGAKISRFASTGRLPLFALASGPKTAKEVRSLKDLENRTVGISALGNADHILVLFLMRRAGADPNRVRFATIGTNLLDALRLGQVGAGIIAHYRSGRWRDRQCYGYRAGKPISRWGVRVHGRGGVRRGARAAQRRDGSARARTRQGLARHTFDPSQRGCRRAAKGIDHRR